MSSAISPFLKWAGGKRWLPLRPEFAVPPIKGRYIEPFLGGGAVFFHCRPRLALLSDLNSELINTYIAIRDDWRSVVERLAVHQELHSDEYYYDVRSSKPNSKIERASRFIYLNRTCWNGLYRENLNGMFNVPRGTKNRVILPEDNFEEVSSRLQTAEIKVSDFEESVAQAGQGDFIFLDPPYTTAHNNNGFIKYNEAIFTWEDQVRLKDCACRAAERGARVVITNADHESLRELYRDAGTIRSIDRASVISGANLGRGRTSELLILMGCD